MAASWRLFWPNLITLLSSLSALGGLYVAYRYQVRECAFFFLFSGLCDALDGPVAKALNAQSRFGSLFDCLSDFLAFGLAPAAALVFLGLAHPGVAAIYILAIQFRLIRFASQEETLKEEKFFRGLSSPDCVYMGFLISYLFGKNFNWGFGIVSFFAVYPWPLWPKGLRVVKLLLGLVATWLFVYG